jgi:hypothetical protein
MGRENVRWQTLFESPWQKCCSNGASDGKHYFKSTCLSVSNKDCHFEQSVPLGMGVLPCTTLTPRCARTMAIGRSVALMIYSSSPAALSEAAEGKHFSMANSLPLRQRPFVSHASGMSLPRPALRAWRMACVRSATCNLLKMFETWLRTVLRLTTREVAIS